MPFVKFFVRGVAKAPLQCRNCFFCCFINMWSSSIQQYSLLTMFKSLHRFNKVSELFCLGAINVNYEHLISMETEKLHWLGNPFMG